MTCLAGLFAFLLFLGRLGGGFAAPQGARRTGDDCRGEAELAGDFKEICGFLGT